MIQQLPVKLILNRLWYCLFCLLLWAPSGVLAQGKTAEKTPPAVMPDTDTLLMKMEALHATLNRIDDITSRGFDTRSIEAGLPDMVANLRTVEQNLVLYSRVLNVKNLQMFRVLLADMHQHLEQWRTTLFRYNKELMTMNADMTAFTKDSFVQQIRADTVFRNFYLPELRALKGKWETVKKATTRNLAQIDRLQADVSRSYFKTVELQTKVDRQLSVVGLKSFGKEFPYLWDAGSTDTLHQTQITEQARKAWEGQEKILEYYLREHAGHWGWMLVISVVFFIWVQRNYRRLRKAGIEVAAVGDAPRYLRPWPVLATLVLVFNMAPFFDLNPPSSYVEIIQLLLLLSLTVFFWRNWPRRYFMWWVVIFFLYFFFSGTGAVIMPGKGMRWWMITLNLMAVALGLLLYNRLYRPLSFEKIVRRVAIVLVVMNVLAIIFNVTGRLSLARVYGIAGMYGLTQIIGLSVFKRIVMESLSLQMQAGKLAGGIQARLAGEKLQAGLGRVLTIVVVIMWLIIFTTHLNIYNDLYEAIHYLVSTRRKIGSTSFTIANIILFFLILYISNLLQKYIGYFFGEVDDTPVGEVKYKSSRLILLRLILLLLGFLLAIAASGLPLDKITVVLGALGVGIGLGLQNIVNNLVSGVILIFERPLKIGDYVEVGGQKGRVKDIGIRSSKLITTEGAEVVMPNGDLISGKLINWTLSNNHVRSEMTFTISPAAQLSAATAQILELAKQSEGVLPRIEPEIFIKAINDTSATLKLQVWLTNVHKEEQFKSRLLEEVYRQLKAGGINVS